MSNEVHTQVWAKPPLKPSRHDNGDHTRLTDATNIKWNVGDYFVSGRGYYATQSLTNDAHFTQPCSMLSNVKLHANDRVKYEWPIRRPGNVMSWNGQASVVRCSQDV